MAYLFFLLPIIIQVLLIVHVVKSGADRYWIYILIFVPIAGGLAYFFVEILPGLLASPKTARIKDKIGDSINPGRKIAELEQQLEIADTVENRKRLADAYVNSGIYDHAIKLYESCLNGVYKDDSYVLESLAQAFYFNRDFENARRVLEQIRKQDLLCRQYKAWFIYTKVLEQTAEFEAIEQEYRELESTFPRLEVLYNHGIFLRNAKRCTEARAKFEEIVKVGRQLPKHALHFERRWITLARRDLSDLS